MVDLQRTFRTRVAVLGQWCILIPAVLLPLACSNQRPPSASPAPPSADAASSTLALCPSGHDRLNERNYAEAAEAFDRCSAANPTLAYTYYYAGMAYRQLGKLDLMSERFEMFIELAPDAPERPRVQAILQSLAR